MKRTSSMTGIPTAQSRELVNFIKNVSRAYVLYYMPVVKNLQGHIKKGHYSTEKAQDAWYSAATNAAKLYCDMYCPGAKGVFSVGDRFAAAVELEEAFRNDWVNSI